MSNKSYQITSHDMFDLTKIAEAIYNVTKDSGSFQGIISGDTLIKILSKANKEISNVTSTVNCCPHCGSILNEVLTTTRSYRFCEKCDIEFPV